MVNARIPLTKIKTQKKQKKPPTPTVNTVLLKEKIEKKGEIDKEPTQVKKKKRKKKKYKKKKKPKTKNKKTKKQIHTPRKGE